MKISAIDFSYVVYALRRQKWVRKSPGALYVRKIRNPGWWLVRCACWLSPRRGLNYVQLELLLHVTPVTLGRWCTEALKRGVIEERPTGVRNEKVFVSL